MTHVELKTLAYVLVALTSDLPGYHKKVRIPWRSMTQTSICPTGQLSQCQLQSIVQALLTHVFSLFLRSWFLNALIVSSRYSLCGKRGD
jgi:hypothetical protein